LKITQGVSYLEGGDLDSSHLMVFFHGYGANAWDLKDFQNLPISCRWIFPNAPLEVAGLSGGRAWFPLREDSESNVLYPTKKTLYYLDRHCKFLWKFIDELQKTSETIILGGFSQGAIMALNLALRTPVKALVIMSGVLFPVESLINTSKDFLKAGHFFQCHGKSDPLLSYQDALKLYEFLKSLKWEGEFYSFDGGHEIPSLVLLKLQEFLTKHI